MFPIFGRASLLLLPISLSVSASFAQNLKFARLPVLPDREGFAAMFAGVSGAALVLAGGANFPEKRPWEGGTKTWYDVVWVLAAPDSAWRRIGKLPRPLAYGISVTFGDEVVCIGGSSAEGHHVECFALRFHGGSLSRRALPPLPAPCANACGALVGDTVYVAGGITRPDATTASRAFWSLNLRKPDASWQPLEPWPGPERMLAVAASLGDAFFLFGGAALHADKDGKPERDWLLDAFSFAPGRGWERLADLPHPAVAAPSPAPTAKGAIALISGDDGSRRGFKPETEHPGFPRDTWLFDSKTGSWSRSDPAPFGRATVPTTFWNGGWIIPSGEARPGYRSPEVWRLDLR